MANAFENEFRKSARLLGVHYRKVAVATTQRRGRTILTTEPGYDAYILKPGGIHVAIELKSKAVHGSFPLSNIADHQLVGLQEVVNLGCPAYLVVNMRREQRGKKRAVCNAAWFLEFRDWMEMLTEVPPWRGKPRQSLPQEVFADPRFWHPLPRIKVENDKGRSELAWDVRVLL